MSEETRILLVNNLKPEDYMIITDNFHKLDKEIERLKSLNEKAIEYIKEHRRADLVFKLYLTEQETDNVLNILQGGDE